MADILTFTMDAPVVEVMLLEDRAQVTRRGRVVLPAGVTRVVVADVSPVLSDKSLTVRILPPSNVQIGDARVMRFAKALREDRPASVRELEEAVESAQKEARLLSEERERIDGQLSDLDRFEELVLEELVQDAAWNRDSGPEAGAQLDRLAEQASALETAGASVQVKSDERQQDLRDLAQRLGRARHPATTVGANLQADLRSETGGPCDLEFSYVVPGACWRPWHTAERISGARPAVRFRSEACVWQNTGEDWKGVALQFSTERLSLGVEPPVLESDVIEARPKAATVAVATREQTVQTTGLGGAAAETAELPGIDDGGEVFAIRSTVKSDIPSDGRPYRVPYGGFESEMETERVLMAELAPAVIRKTVQTNTATVPLLAGPVDLIGDGGYLGRTIVKLVAPNERFPLGWGPESALRVFRELEQVDEESGLMNNTITSRRVVTVRLSNIGAQEMPVKVTERVPVSEIEQVEITVDRKETTQGKGADEHGFVTWDVRLAAFGQETLRLVYRVKRRKDIAGI